MKKIIYTTIVATTLLLCANNSTETTNADNSVKILNLSDTALRAYQIYVEEMLAKRAKSFKLFNKVKDKDILSGADLDEMSKMLVHHLDTKDISEQYISKYQYLVDNDDGEYTQKDRFELVMISLSAMLIRYDDYLLVYKKFNDNKKLREELNDENSAYGIPKNVLQNIANKYYSNTQRNKVKKMIDFYNDNKEEYEDEKSSFFLYMKDLIENSPSYQVGFDDTKSSALGNIKNIHHIAYDIGDDALDLLLNEVSKDFGNSAGLVATRKGKLYNRKEVAKDVRLAIKPGDILLEKTPFRLTDKLIPGHWGHAAVYIGDEEELQKLGIWKELETLKNSGDRYFTQARIDEIREQIRDSKVIDEALRDGVQLNTIEHFLNIDDLAIMHDLNESLEDKKQRIILTLRQLGKDYDFKFDVETSIKIVCSELIYATDILHDWPTENSAGINTISPDNVAIKSVDDNIYSLPLLYHDGKKITTNKKTYMKGLLDGSIK